jgi:hypothetical protein
MNIEVYRAKLAQAVMIVVTLIGEVLGSNLSPHTDNRD